MRNRAMRRALNTAGAVICLVAVLLGVASLAGFDPLAWFATAQPSQNRRAAWGQPLDMPGVPNLHRVSPCLYRGAQPTAEGMGELRKLGVRTVVNLRQFHSDRDELAGQDLAYEHIAMLAAWPTEEQLIRFLRIVGDQSRQPVFVHCQHGADRTGTMCATYRIVVEGWSKDEAIREMTQGGFGFHEVWKNLIEYVQGLDVERLRREAGIAEPIGVGQVQ
jgi:protein tyrosine/serine phosphatase